MSNFLKSVLASCLGVSLAFLFIILIFIGVASSIGGGKVKSKEGVLKLDFSQIIPEKTNNVNVSPFEVEQEDFIGLRDVLKMIKHAKGDVNIKGILIQSNNNVNGLATSENILNALKDFKESGKFLYAYADDYSQGAYLLATEADSVFINPNGMVDLKGYAVMYPFIKGLMDKLGVSFDVFYAGDFKSATEPIRRTDMSPQNKQQTREFLSDIYAGTSKVIAANRKLAQDQVNHIIDDQLGRNATLALESGLVDKICYLDELENSIRSKTGLPNQQPINYITLSDYFKTASLVDDVKIGTGKVAVVFAEGDVVYGNDEKGNINDEKYIKILEKIRNDDKVKAVVLRVNSGGGSALTSDIIWREIELIKAKGVPVVASFGDYAASGGYYIACGADSIVALPSTLTGSIGVFSILPNAKQLFNDKLGITFDTVRTHSESIQMSTVYHLTEVQKSRFQESNDAIYSQFLDRVAQGRGMPKDIVQKYAQGRIWSGAKALEIGLVDVLGDLDRAIEIAAEMAGISEAYRIVEFPKIQKSLLEQILKEAMVPQEEEETVRMLNHSLKDFLFMKKIVSQDGVQARLPFKVELE